MREDKYNIIKGLKRAYKIALLCIAMLATASCAILVKEIIQKESSSRIINISGRQRMLSQNIAKNLLLLNNSGFSEQIQADGRKELLRNHSSWVKAQHALQYGDASLNIPQQKLSATIAGYFKQIEPSYNYIDHICRDVLSDKSVTREEVEILLNNEKVFLDLMDKITFQFDAEAKEEVIYLKRCEIFFWLLTLITLLIEAWLIFRPIISIVHKSMNDYDRLFEEKKKHELASLNAIVEAQENERRRIANELHDGIAPMLSLVKVKLSTIPDADAGSASMATIDMAKDLTDTIISELRSISYNLMPFTLTQFGLIPALEELTANMQQDAAISFRLVHQTARQSFGRRIDINIYRVIQELISNTLKHTEGTVILLQIFEHDDTVTITFENNGRSFDPVSEQNKSECAGLKNMITRVRTLEGTIDFDTHNDGDIVISIEIPIPATQD